MSWRDYSEDELNAQYSPRISMPDFVETLEGFKPPAKAARDALDHQLDIRYGPGPKETFDIFPADSTNAPVHIFFHGGYWQAEDKNNHSFVAPDLVAEGYTVILPNYDLCPEVDIATINQQAARCVQYIYDHADDLGIDRDRISVSGHSAGGQIVAKLCAHDFGAPIIKAAMPISGVFDLEPLVGTVINGALGMDVETAKACSPYYDSIRVEGRIEVAVGGGETEEFHRQSELYAAKCRDAGFKVVSHEVGDADHLRVLAGLFTKDGSSHSYLLDFLKNT